MAERRNIGPRSMSKEPPKDRTMQAMRQRLNHLTRANWSSIFSTLHAMVLQLLSDVNEKNRQIDDLQNQLEWFKRHVFGRRSEKIAPNQLTLFQGMTADQCEGEEQGIASEESNQGLTDSSGKPRTHLNGRRPLPEDLPRERIEYHPPQEDLICSCCGQTKQAIGEEVTEELDYVPASFVVRQHCRIKYACKNCQEGVVIADLPARPIEKGRPGTLELKGGSRYTRSTDWSEPCRRRTSRLSS